MAEGKKARGRPREFDRAKALNTALKLFWAKGYEQATVADLCAVMGINPPSLYAAFTNKASLFLEAVRQYEQEHWAAPAKKFLACVNIHRAFYDYFQEAAAILISPAAPCGCMTVVAALNINESETEVIAELKKLRQAPTDMFLSKLRQGMETGQIPLDTNVPVLALTLTALLEGMSLQARSGIYLADLKAMAALAVRLLPPAQEKAPIRPMLF